MRLDDFNVSSIKTAIATFLLARFFKLREIYSSLCRHGQMIIKCPFVDDFGRGEM